MNKTTFIRIYIKAFDLYGVIDGYGAQLPE